MSYVKYWDFPRFDGFRDVKQFTHLLLALRLKSKGAIAQLPLASSWSCAVEKFCFGVTDYTMCLHYEDQQTNDSERRNRNI